MSLYTAPVDAYVPVSAQYQSRLCRLPREIRDQIYDFLYPQRSSLSCPRLLGLSCLGHQRDLAGATAILRSCRLLHPEARAVLYSNTTFKMWRGRLSSLANMARAVRHLELSDCLLDCNLEPFRTLQRRLEWVLGPFTALEALVMTGRLLEEADANYDEAWANRLLESALAARCSLLSVKSSRIGLPPADTRSLDEVVEEMELLFYVEFTVKRPHSKE